MDLPNGRISNIRKIKLNRICSGGVTSKIKRTKQNKKSKRTLNSCFKSDLTFASYE